MQIYLVGGAVRDKLLNQPVSDRDWVVVGATEKAMEAAGFTRVGRDFPIFLHPETREEYALARTERKTGQGYLGFTCHASPEVSLEEDLSRRDLTVNAIAESADGAYIDPYGGRADLQARVLRHVSPAFSEDPLRVLRVARFVAQFEAFGFQVASETLALMRQMSQGHELGTLTAERIWQETEKALATHAPAKYFETLNACGALHRLFREAVPLVEIPPDPWRSVSNTHAVRPGFLHLRELFKQTQGQSLIAFAQLSYGVAQCAAEPLQAVQRFLDRLKPPKRYRELAQLTVTHAHRFSQLAPEDPEQLLQCLNAIDVWRRPARLDQLLRVYENINYPVPEESRVRLQLAYQVCQPLRFVPRGQVSPGVLIKALLYRQRLAAVTAALGERRGAL